MFHHRLMIEDIWWERDKEQNVEWFQKVHWFSDYSCSLMPISLTILICTGCTDLFSQSQVYVAAYEIVFQNYHIGLLCFKQLFMKGKQADTQNIHIFL